MSEKEMIELAFKKLIDETSLIWCDYCSYDVPCNSECRYYIQGCQDMEREECPGRRNTPCYNCNNGDNFIIDYNKIREFIKE